MRTQTGVGQALAELVKRLSPEEKKDFVHWLSWDELEILRREEWSLSRVSEVAVQPVRRIGDPQMYVGATRDGLALELPVTCVTAFVERLPDLLSTSQVEVYLRQNGKGQEFRISAEAFTEFLQTHRDAWQDNTLMLEFGSATLVSGGGGCISLSLEGMSTEVRRRLAREALRVCGFDYQFVGDSFTAAVWDEELEVLDL